MADLSDVENVLVSTLAQAIYPNGTAQGSIVGNGVRIFRGWPIPANLDSDLRNGVVNVSVFPKDTERNVTAYPRDWEELPPTAPGLSLTVSGNTVTVGGTITLPCNLAVLVNGQAFVYAVQPSDTLVSIATGLTALINASFAGTSSGAVITISGANGSVQLAVSGPLSKRFGGAILASLAGFWGTGKVTLSQHVEANGNVIREVKRQKRVFQITFWCPDWNTRDSIAGPCDLALSTLSYLALPDGSSGRIIYQGAPVSDRVEREGLYRRDLLYSVEYGTTQTESLPRVVTQQFNLTGGLDPNAAPLTSFSI